MSSPESDHESRDKQKDDERKARKLIIMANERRIAKQQQRLDEERMEAVRIVQEAKEKKKQKELKQRRKEIRKKKRLAYELRRVEDEKQRAVDRERIRIERDEQDEKELLAEELKCQAIPVDTTVENTPKKLLKSKESKNDKEINKKVLSNKSEKEKKGRNDKKETSKKSAKEKTGRKGIRKGQSITSDEIRLPFKDPILLKDIYKDYKNVVYFEEDYDEEYLKSGDYFDNWEVSSSMSSSDADVPDESAFMLKYPFTYNSRLRNEYRQRLEESWQKHELGKMLRNKLKSLNTLKQTMTSTKLTYCCHREERRRREDQRRRKMENFLENKYQIDVKHLPKDSNVVEKYKKYKSEKRELEVKQLERRIAIVEKLLHEEKRKHNTTNVRECEKVRTIKKPSVLAVNEEDVVEEVTVEITPETLDEVEVDEFVDVPTESDDEAKTEKKKKKKDKTPKEKSTKKKKKDESQAKTSPKAKKGKSSSKKNSGKKKERKGKRGKFKEAKVPTPPLLPITRLRPEANNIVTELLIDFKTTHEIDELRRDTIPMTSLIKETAFDWRPSVVYFVDFQPRHRYTARVRLSNLRCSSTLWCRFQEIEYPEEDFPEPAVLKVKDLLDVKKVCPGLGFVFEVAFYPTDSTSSFEARLVFVTKRVGEHAHRQFAIPISCSQSVPGIKIIPESVNFPAVPIWNNGMYGIFLKKNVKVVNSFPIDVTLTIKRKETIDEAMIDKVDEQEISNMLQKIALSDVDQEASWKEFVERTAVCLSSIDDRIFNSTSDQRQCLMFRTVSRWNMNEPRWCTEELHVVLMCRELLDECLDNVLAPFTIQPQYNVVVPANSDVDLTLRFCVEEPGVYKEAFTMDVDTDFELNFTMSGEATPLPLSVEPKSVDFHVCIQDCDVYEHTVVVRNDFKLPCAVTPVVPRCLRAHFSVDPKEAFVQAHGHSPFRLRFTPGWKLPFDAPDYFLRAADNYFKFTLKLKIRCAALGACPPLEVYIHANITSAYNLDLRPAHLDLGRVSTLETAKYTLHLTNHTLSPHDYFLKTPKEYVHIDPGKIQPGQTIPLTLSYHPSPINIEGNVLGAPGLEGHHYFVLELTTAACMRGKYKGNSKNLIEAILEERGFLRPRSCSVTLEEKMEDVVKETAYEFGTDSSAGFSDDCSLPVTASMRSISEVCLEEECLHEYMEDIMTHEVDEKESSPGLAEGTPTSLSTSTTSKMIPSISLKNLLIVDDDDSIIIRTDRLHDPRILKTLVTCEALVYDPHCSLSAAVIEFPPTPCGSRSVVHIRVLGENTGTTRPCHCGLLAKEAHFAATYAFSSSSKSVVFTPSRGRLQAGEVVDVAVVFRPELPEYVVAQKAREMKMNVMVAELNHVRAKFEKDALKKFEKKRPKSPKDIEDVKQKALAAYPEVDCEALSINLEPNDMYPAEKNLLEVMESSCKTFTATCVIDTALSDGDHHRREIHPLTLVCPVVRPDFVLRLDSQRLQFDAVALGTRAVRRVFVVSISSSVIKVQTSTMNPDGPFFCPPQPDRWIEQEHTLIVTVVFTPLTTEVVSEYLDITSGLTLSTLCVRGWGVVPEFTFKPDFRFYRFESKGKKVDCSVVIENICDAPLPFRIALLYVKEAVDKPNEEKKSGKAEKGKDKKAKDKKASKAKKVKPKKMALELPPEEKLALEEEFKDFESDTKSTIFTLIDVDGKDEVVVEPHQKRTFKVRFTPPGGDVEKGKGREKSEDGKKKKGESPSSGGKKKEKSASPGKKGKGTSPRKGESDKKYAAVFDVILGNMVEVRQLVFMGSMKKEKSAKTKK